MFRDIDLARGTEGNTKYCDVPNIRADEKSPLLGTLRGGRSLLIGYNSSPIKSDSPKYGCAHASAPKKTSGVHRLVKRFTELHSCLYLFDRD